MADPKNKLDQGNSENEIRLVNFTYLRDKADSNIDAANQWLKSSIGTLITAASIGIAITGPLYQSPAIQLSPSSKEILFVSAVLLVVSVFAGLMQMDENRKFQLMRSNSYATQANMFANIESDLKTQQEDAKIMRKATKTESSHNWWTLQKWAVVLGLICILAVSYQVLLS